MTSWEAAVAKAAIEAGADPGRMVINFLEGSVAFHNWQGHTEKWCTWEIKPHHLVLTCSRCKSRASKMEIFLWDHGMNQQI